MEELEAALAPVVEEGGFATLALVSTGENLREWIYFTQSGEEFSIASTRRWRRINSRLKSAARRAPPGRLTRASWRPHRNNQTSAAVTMRVAAVMMSWLVSAFSVRACEYTAMTSGAPLGG